MVQQLNLTLNYFQDIKLLNMLDMKNKTPSEILKETSVVVVDDIDLKEQYIIVSFYDDNDSEIITISIEPIHLSIIMNYILKNHDDISVYQIDLSNILIPSRKQLYNALEI